MKTFDYSFLNKQINGEVVNLISMIYEFKERTSLKILEHPITFKELENIAIIQSVKGSNAIEGIITSDERIRAIVNENTAPLNHNEEEIEGYRDVLKSIHNNYNNIPFNEITFKEFHYMMENKAKPFIAGQYKVEDNAIIEIDVYGNRKIRFNPIPALEVDKAMEQFVLAYIEARDQQNINPLLLIPCVILDFLCIHPFSDGNGRMSRILSLLLLYKNGFTIGKYISFEEQINKYKNYYYEDLKKSSQNWHENNNDYFYFIKNFLIILLKCYQELDKRFLTVDSKKINKESRIEGIVLKSITPLSKQEIADILPDISITTIEMVLGKLIKENKIIKIGSGRSTRYLNNNKNL